MIREVLSRLLRLNHERYAEEVGQGLHEKGRKAVTPPPVTLPTVSAQVDADAAGGVAEQMDLF